MRKAFKEKLKRVESEQQKALDSLIKADSKKKEEISREICDYQKLLETFSSTET